MSRTLLVGDDIKSRLGWGKNSSFLPHSFGEHNCTIEFPGGQCIAQRYGQELAEMRDEHSGRQVNDGKRLAPFQAFCDKLATEP